MSANGAVVKRYLSAIRDHDWEALRTTLEPDVVRIGPFSDMYRGVDDYVAFISRIVPSLAGYEMTVSRVAEFDGGAVVELSETVVEDGVAKRTDESLVFDIHDGFIRRIAIYIQTPVELSGDPTSASLP